MIKRELVRACRAVMLAALAMGAMSGMAVFETGFAASEGHGGWSDQPNSKVRLLSGTVTNEGEPALYAGVQLRMDEGWKTYWRNPGDSGVPPSFDWSGSRNVKNIEVFYPAPHRFADAGGTAIGYDGEVVFPLRITPERAGEPVTLALTFDYGLCKDLCIPNSVALQAELPAGLGEGDGAVLGNALSTVPKGRQEGDLPRVVEISAKLDGEVPGVEIEAAFPEGATDTDVFVHNRNVLVPVPKPLGPLADGKQRFAVAFLVPEEAAAIKGKPLTVTLVSDKGATETVWTVR